MQTHCGMERGIQACIVTFLTGKRVDSNDRVFCMDSYRFLEAALTGDAAAVAGGLAEGMKPDVAGPQMRTPLMLAAFNGHTGIVEALIQAGADVNRRDEIGRTALMFASTGAFPETVQALIQNGAAVNINDHGERWTPLMWAAAEGHAEVVKVLLDAGADRHVQDVDDDTARDFAVQKGHPEVAALLDD